MKAKPPLSTTERRAVEAAIAAAEQSTSAEFVAAVVRRVEHHHAVSLSAALAAAQVVPVVVLLWDPWISVAVATGIQCAVFAVVYAVFELSLLAAWLAPRRKRAMKVRRFAQLLFFERGLGSLPAHNGVLLLVSLAERQVEIVADHALDALVETAEWQRIVDAFAAGARSGKVAAALEAAIGDLGAVLGRHFPPRSGQANRIPDRLIEF